MPVDRLAWLKIPTRPKSVVCCFLPISHWFLVSFAARPKDVLDVSPNVGRLSWTAWQHVPEHRTLQPTQWFVMGYY
jgi:hypothetical protein